MRKGCLLAVVGAVSLVMVVVVGGCYWAVSQYEKRPKKPGEAELMAIQEDLLIYRDSEGFGNTAEARDMAVGYARALRMARQVLFTEGKAGGVSLSKGRFIAYCNLSSNKCAFIVHVPELRRYAPEAKLSMAETAWRTAYAYVQTNEIKELAMGIRGAVSYGGIFVGTTGATNAMAAIKQRDDGVNDEVLYPFFIGAPRPFPTTKAPAAAASKPPG